MSISRKEIRGPAGELRIIITDTAASAADLIKVEIPRRGRLVRLKGSVDANTIQPRLLEVEDAAVAAFSVDELVSPLEAAADEFDVLVDVPYLLERGVVFWHIQGTAANDLAVLEILLQPVWEGRL